MSVIAALCVLIVVTISLGYEILPRYTYRGEHRAEDRP
jgi:hypothetical protein